MTTVPLDYYPLANESDENTVVTVVGVAPTRRDVWAILRGRYRPKVRRVETVTLKGMDKILRGIYTRESLKDLEAP